MKVEGAVEVVLDELALWSDRFELMNTNTLGPPFNVLTTARKFVEFPPLNFLC